MSSEEGPEVARQMGATVLRLRVRGQVVVSEMEKTEVFVRRAGRARDKVGEGEVQGGRGRLVLAFIRLS